MTVVGLAKNAGKTTVVNHLLERLPCRLGLASLGLDGEERDALTRLPKPRVRPPAGALVATTAALADGAAIAARLPYRTALGEVVLAVAPGGAPLHVSGPARLDELEATLAELRRAGARLVLLEGALGRLGTAAPALADAVVVAAGAALAASDEALERSLRLALDALAPPVCAEPAALRLERCAGYEAEAVERIAAERPPLVELRGALTGPLLEGLIRRGLRPRLVAADATRLLARPQQLARARRGGIDVAVRRALKIVAVTASPFHPDLRFDAERAFAAAFAAAAGRWPVFDVVSGRSAP